jgi:hypothetical protein
MLRWLKTVVVSVIRVLGLKPAEHRRGRPGGGASEPHPVEMPLQSAFIGRPPQLSS